MESKLPSVSSSHGTRDVENIQLRNSRSTLANLPTVSARNQTYAGLNPVNESSKRSLTSQPSFNFEQDHSMLHHLASYSSDISRWNTYRSHGIASLEDGERQASAFDNHFSSQGTFPEFVQDLVSLPRNSTKLCKRPFCDLKPYSLISDLCVVHAVDEMV